MVFSPTGALIRLTTIPRLPDVGFFSCVGKKMDLPDAIWGHVFWFGKQECKRVVEKVSQRFEHIVRSDALCRARWGVVGETRWACVGCDKIEGAAFHPVPWYYDVAHQRRRPPTPAPRALPKST